jgi:enterochelin esterase-like enzyme
MSPNRMAAMFAVLLVTAGMAVPLAAQVPGQRPTTPNDTLTTPVVSPDRTVTFKIYAPEADSVAVIGDWVFHGLGEPGRLTRNDAGVWSATIGPLPPDWYTYTYAVDGVRTADPKSALIKPGVSTIENMVLVPGPEAEYETIQAVPHGKVHIGWYESGTLGETRSLRVYTPPGYDGSGRDYPVFYLLHGGGDNDSGWTTIGMAHVILDNLIAEGKAEPMIVVMPNGSLPRPDAGSGPGTNWWATMMERYRSELANDVMPYVERNYRVLDGPENTAIAGLSMGGMQTLGVAPSNLDTFGYVGVWSMGLEAGSPMEAQFREDNPEFFQADVTNGKLELLSIAVGSNDFLYQQAKDLDRMLTEAGIEHEYHETEGGHTWINWRRYLRDFAQELFRR